MNCKWHNEESNIASTIEKKHNRSHTQRNTEFITFQETPLNFLGKDCKDLVESKSSSTHQRPGCTPDPCFSELLRSIHPMSSMAGLQAQCTWNKPAECLSQLPTAQRILREVSWEGLLQSQHAWTMDQCTPSTVFSFPPALYHDWSKTKLQCNKGAKEITGFYKVCCQAVIIKRCKLITKFPLVPPN